MSEFIASLETKVGALSVKRSWLATPLEKQKDLLSNGPTLSFQSTVYNTAVANVHCF